MEVSIIDKSDVAKELNVRVPAAELIPHFEKAYKQSQAKMEIKGFRKGKAPLDLIKRIYGESIEYDSLNSIASDILKQVITEKNIQLVGEPVLKDINYKRGDDFCFTITFATLPNFELKPYKGIQVVRSIHIVTEEEIDYEIKRLRHANSTTSEVETATDDSHILTVDIQILDESGTPLIGKKLQGQKIYLEDESIDPEIRNALKNVSVGERRNFKQVVKKAEKNITNYYDFNVKKIERINLPEFDNDFVKKVTKGKQTNVKEFREHIRSELEAYWQEYNERKLIDELIGEVVRLHDITVPEIFVNAIIEERIEKLRKQQPNEKFPKDFDENQFREKEKPHAIFQAKWSLISQRIIEKEGFTVTDTDIELRAEAEAAKIGLEKGQLINFYKTSDTLKDRILSEKLIDFLKKNAKIVEKVDQPTPEILQV